MGPTRNISILLTVPALLVVAALFVYPLGFSLVGAFQDKAGEWTFANFGRAWELYRLDTAFTVVIVLLSCVLIALASIAIGGYLTLGESKAAKAILNFLYRWPLFIPFIVAAQCMRTFIARNGMMNMTLVYFGILSPQNISFELFKMMTGLNLGDYGTANALGFVSYLMTGFAAWFYLRHGMREKGAQ